MLNDAARPHNELTAKEVADISSLVAPASLVLGFRPDAGYDVRFDQAIRFVVGLMHVEPPKPWGPASENDALGDAVIEEFLDSRRTTPQPAGRSGMGRPLYPEEADRNGLSPYPAPGWPRSRLPSCPTPRSSAFRSGVLRITAKGRVTYDLKAKIVAEMAPAALEVGAAEPRSGHRHPPHPAADAGLAGAARQRLAPRHRRPGQLLDEALGGTAGPGARRAAPGSSLAPQQQLLPRHAPCPGPGDEP